MTIDFMSMILPGPFDVYPYKDRPLKAYREIGTGKLISEIEGHVTEHGDRIRINVWNNNGKCWIVHWCSKEIVLLTMQEAAEHCANWLQSFTGKLCSAGGWQLGLWFEDFAGPCPPSTDPEGRREWIIAALLYGWRVGPDPDEFEYPYRAYKAQLWLYQPIEHRYSWDDEP